MKGPNVSGLNYDAYLDSAALTIDGVHHEIHEGHHFTYTRFDTIAAAGTIELLITPNGSQACHMFIVGMGTAETTFKLYEGTTRAGGSAQVAFDNNRISKNSPTMTINLAPSGGALGVLIDSVSFGASTGGARSPAMSRSDAEWILRTGKYLLVIGSGTNGNIVSTRLQWYEPQ